MTFTRCAYEQCFHGQTRAERRLHQAYSFDAHDAVAALLPAQASAESLQPAIISATNERTLFSQFFSLSFRFAAKRHIHEPNADFSLDQSDGAAGWLKIRPSGESFPPEHRTLRALNAANVYVSFTPRFSGPVGICSRNVRGGLYFYAARLHRAFDQRASRVRALLEACRTGEV